MILFLLLRTAFITSGLLGPKERQPLEIYSQIPQGYYLGINSNETGTQNKYHADSGFELSLFADLSNYQDSLGINLAYTLVIEAVSRNTTSGTIISGFAQYDASLLNSSQ